MTTTRPENELLICVARRSLSGDIAARIASLAATRIDWNYLINTATQQGVMPLLYSHLSSACPQCVPREVLARLRNAFVANSKSCLLLFGELRKLLRLFSEKGITAVAFKGPLLSVEAYGDLCLRQAGDLDILIKKHDFSLAKEILVTAGYRLATPLTKSQEASHLRFHCEIPFLSNGLSVVDLHWGLSPKSFRFALNPRQVMERCESTIIQGTSLLTFAREDTILYLCFHGGKHYWSRLEWISSLAEFIRTTQNINWSKILERANESHGRRMLIVGLMLARKLGGVEIPESILSDGGEFESLSKYTEGIQARIFVDTSGPPRSVEAFRSNLKIMDRKRDAIISFLRAIFVPTISDWQELALPGALYPLYYLFRPLRLLKKYSANGRG